MLVGRGSAFDAVEEVLPVDAHVGARAVEAAETVERSAARAESPDWLRGKSGMRSRASSIRSGLL